MAAMGHIPGPLVLQIDADDLGKGVWAGLGTPRYSTAYADARHLPSVLLEAHSLKPYRQRVLGTYVLMESALRLLARQGAALRQAITADRARRAGEVALDWKAREGAPQMMPFAGIEYSMAPSSVSGGKRVTWSGRKATLQVPVIRGDVPAARATRPRAYWIPPAWPEVIERLEAHGIRVERIAQPREVDVEAYRLKDAKLEAAAFEGHVRVTATAAPRRIYKYYELVMAAFVTVLLCANLIGASKVCRLGPVTFGAGVLFFPISYVFGDVLTVVSIGQRCGGLRRKGVRIIAAHQITPVVAEISLQIRCNASLRVRVLVEGRCGVGSR